MVSEILGLLFSGDGACLRGGGPPVSVTEWVLSYTTTIYMV